MTILDTIIQEKKREVTHLKNKTFEQTVYEPLQTTFAAQIKARNTMGVIAEIKRASPSKGMINADVDPVKQAKFYEENGANAISILTDAPFFKGSMDDLRAVRQAVNLPILCKDFIIDTVQIDQAKAAGANIILLIAAALDDESLHTLYNYATTHQLEVICEVNNEVEMERVLKLGATLIGVNNRDLKTFEVDLNTTSRLAHLVNNEDVILIGESGITTPEDVRTLANAGAEAILVGETLMRAEDVGATLASYQVDLPTESRF